ncbi:hypothetical protein B0T26DRAFT_122195 [Lasiosphaeria miniovina]|uniref:Secreted protein n=1 Tax=Lasiosphaeria miniovina TaxID=1954250 RepID=A0AA40B477_9PEZI|nr:uncharacterized protein B0T26DRAFT_122195 [Lasiosphaeria miniovina]KAK0727193.1 hypothetical protein B0T26DRAFT_122195 [Lasiosphaeria miniovina]
MLVLPFSFFSLLRVWDITWLRCDANSSTTPHSRLPLVCLPVIFYKNMPNLQPSFFSFLGLQPRHHGEPFLAGECEWKAKSRSDTNRKSRWRGVILPSRARWAWERTFDAVPELLRLRFSCLVSLLSFGKPPTSNEICQSLFPSHRPTALLREQTDDASGTTLSFFRQTDYRQPLSRVCPFHLLARLGA